MPQLKLNLIQGSVSFNFTPDAAIGLQKEISQLLQSLKAVAAAGGKGKPTPHKPMEYRHEGEVFLEIFCNPNIYPSPFAAKVLLTIKDDRLRLTAEAELTRVIEDVNEYLEQVS